MRLGIGDIQKAKNVSDIPASGGIIENLPTILEGIKSLMIDYQNMKGNKIPQNKIDGIFSGIKLYLQILEMGGKGDMKIGEVINSLPYTLKDINNIIRNFSGGNNQNLPQLPPNLDIKK